VLLCIALSLNISILQLKLKKRFGEKNIKKIWDGNKIEKKTGDLNSPISPISKTHLFLKKALKNDSTTDREIGNELNLISLDIKKRLKFILAHS
jgi:hypothetical protein